MYAKKLNKKKIYGQTNEDKRSEYFERFRSPDDLNVIFITSVGTIYYSKLTNCAGIGR